MINSSRIPTGVIWSAAALSAALGAAIVYDADPGINWGLWILSAALALVVVRKLSGLPLEKPQLILLAWATVLASSAAITHNEFKHVLAFLGTGMLLGLAVIVTGTSRWSSLSSQLLPTIPFLAPARVWLGTFREAAGVPRNLASPRARSVIRGLFLTVPIVLVLFALLHNADPIIAWVWTRLGEILPDWSFSTRVLFFLFLLSLTLGASSIAARQAEPRLPGLPRLPQGSTIGMTEQRMVLITVAIILWIFVTLQISYLFHSPPDVVGSGVTFAEYARRGFFELSLAATVVGGLIVLLEATRAGDLDADSHRSIKRLEIALLIAVQLILFSAFRRVILYEQAYGFTVARLFAQAYMIVLSLALVALALEVAHGGISSAFGRRVAEIALAMVTVLVFWNYDAWIVDRNIDRARETGKFDYAHAARLSGDAIPTLIGRRAELGPDVAQQIEAAIQCTSRPTSRRWFEWNVRAEEERKALASAHPAPCPSNESLAWSRYSNNKQVVADSAGVEHKTSQ
jgi:hypothetical protein